MNTPNPDPAAPPGGHRAKRPSMVRLVFISVLGLGVVCLALWGLVFFESGMFSTGQPNLTATAISANNASCRQLVEEAMRESDQFCKDIGTNQLCYGNFSVQAEIVQGANVRFSQRGDVIDVDVLRRLSAAPLDLTNQAWGIAVFKVTANLPRSLPGQTVTLLVFGNTTLNKDEPGLQTFYFFSDTGQVICDEVPFDGLMITMPDGAGAAFNINGSELVLTGTASITANRGGQMNISLYNGSAQVTSNGQTQIFGPGQQVSIPLGGENGTEAVGPPSEPVPLSEEELALSCTMTGENCEKLPIPTVALDDLAATLQSELDPTPDAADTLAPAPTPLASTPLPSPTNFPTVTLPLPQPSATLAPAATRTRKPNPTATYTLPSTFTSTMTMTMSPTVTTTLTATNTSTSTGTNTPTGTATATSTATATASSTATATNTQPAGCASLTTGTINFSSNQLSVPVTNTTGSNIFVVGVPEAIWVDDPVDTQAITEMVLESTQVWSGTSATSPSSHTFTTGGGRRRIDNGQTKTLIVTFAEPLASGFYSLEIEERDLGCILTVTGSIP